MKKRFILMMLSLSMLVFAGCAYPAGIQDPTGTAAGESAKEDQEEETDTMKEEAEEEENYDTGDATKDDPRNGDDIGDKEILVVSFGTSYNDSRRLTIGAIEGAVEEAFPDYSVRRAFTSQIIIDHINKRDGILIDNVEAALKRASDNNVKELVVVPTHLMDGFEYNDLVKEVGNYSDAFEKVSVSKPLLSSDEDLDRVADIIAEAVSGYDDGETAICFMGHGTEAGSNKVYARMQEVIDEKGLENIYIGTVEASPSVEDVLSEIADKGYKKAVLRPLMVVAGDHANNDMAGDDEDSWKTLFSDAGYEVTTVVEGLGQLEGIRDIYVEHVKAAVSGNVATEEDMAEVKDVSFEGMEPVAIKDINDGEYDIIVDSSSSMFRIVSAKLLVKEGEARAVMNMGGTGYKYVFMGTGEEASKADGSEYIEPVENEDGSNSFEIRVEALDAEIPLAAFSKNKEMWYDRTLVFRADSLDKAAFKEDASKKVSDLSLEDGSYEAEVSLKGGSGKASVTSPAGIVIEDGKCMAEIEWSSPNYDYMVVDNEKILNESTGGNSRFTIPVAYFDEEIKVIADTTAMSKPHEIEYTLCFDSSSIKESGEDKADSEDVKKKNMK
ncbi:MAG: sirohydrochlorin cobaltochelatase [Lachnospiraceae bacterium]|nr:sirohydrochlorin cobaltochelatase [Lachnospiraceae bacterium]